MPHSSREMRNAYSREYKRRMRADPVRKARERKKERELYAATREQTAEQRAQKNARYRERHRAELAEKQRARHTRLMRDDPAYREACRVRSAQNRRHMDAGARSRNRARSRRYYDSHKNDPEFKRKNVLRSTTWTLALDLSAPENIQRRIKVRLRQRIRKAIKRGPKTCSAVRGLGCTVAELMAHLEAQFGTGMTWANYGEWHIDHIRPLDSFDLTDPKQAASACHYTNLQPLWAIDNIRKGRTWRPGKPRPAHFSDNYRQALLATRGEHEPQ